MVFDKESILMTFFGIFFVASIGHLAICIGHRSAFHTLCESRGGNTITHMDEHFVYYRTMFSNIDHACTFIRGRPVEP